MSEPTTDEKIQQLVRSVLQAVDTRLDAVRHDLAVYAAEEEQRHHQVLGTIASLERRLGDLERADTARRSSSSNIQERLDEMNERIDRLARPGAAPAPSVTGTHDVVPPAPDLDRISRPLFQGPHVTTRVPVVPPLSAHDEMAPPPAPPSVPPAALPAVPQPGDEAEPEIDIDRLTALLSEKLGHLSLQPRHE
jgi:hypothetical protein